MIQIAVYTVLAFLFIRFCVTLYNFISHPVLPKVEKDLRGLPAVSILVPARNEEKNMGKLLSSLSRLPDTNIIEILVLNDHSTDKTKEIIEHGMQVDKRLKLIQGKELPQGWLGKNWACHQLSIEAKGDWLLFIDADVEIAPWAVSNAVQRAEVYDLDLLSLFPSQKMITAGEKSVVPLMHYLLLSLLPLRLVRTSSLVSLAAANGQFMLFRALVYHLYRCHERVKNNVLDDVNIMKLMKQHQRKGEVLLGNGQVVCRMYSSGREAFDGFSKNIFPGFGNNITAILVYYSLICGLPVLLWFDFFWWQKIVFICMVLLIRIMISLLAHQPVLINLIFHAWQMIMYTAIGMNSMFLHLTKRVQWKGRRLN